LSALLAILLVTVAFGQETVIPARIVGVTDGDTVKALTSDFQLLKIRLSWIDAPELSQAFGYRAKQAMSAMVFGRHVELRIYGLDRYGRTLAVIILDGADVNLAMVRSGMAWVYDRYIAETDAGTQADYYAAQAAAQKQGRGLWADPNPIEPWEYRRNARP
jgi:endonuclease YncB( thermonuclease family)